MGTVGIMSHITRVLLDAETPLTPVPFTSTPAETITVYTRSTLAEQTTPASGTISDNSVEVTGLSFVDQDCISLGFSSRVGFEPSPYLVEIAYTFGRDRHASRRARPEVCLSRVADQVGGFQKRRRGVAERRASRGKLAFVVALLGQPLGRTFAPLYPRDARVPWDP